MSSMRGRDDSGFTLVEFMVAMSLFVTLMAVTMSVVVASNDAVATASQVQNLNEEARQAINRMSRDLRQANTIVTGLNPDNPPTTAGGIVAVRFTADYDGDQCIGGVAIAGVTPTPTCLVYNAGNPEDLTYCYDPGTRQLYVADNQGTPLTAPLTCSGGQPLLAGNVAGFTIEYNSNQYQYDASSPSDGVTTWRELDAAAPPVGNNNSALDVELADIDSLVLNLTMSVDGHQQTYRTQVDLRNKSQ